MCISLPQPTKSVVVKPVGGACVDYPRRATVDLTMRVSFVVNIHVQLGDDICGTFWPVSCTQAKGFQVDSKKEQQENSPRHRTIVGYKP